MERRVSGCFRGGRGAGAEGAALKLTVGSVFRDGKEGADISNAFGRAELRFHGKHFDVAR